MKFWQHPFSHYFLENFNAPNPATGSSKPRLPQALPTSGQVLISRTYTSTGQLTPAKPSPFPLKASPFSLLAS